MADESIMSPEPLIDTDPAPPAPGAEDQKPNAEPAPAADDQNAETPEQQEAKRESRRARSNARKARELAEARTEARIYREQLELERASKQPESGEPKRDDTDPSTGEPYSYEEHLKRVARYEARQETAAGIKAEREASQRQAQQGRAQQANAETAKGWIEREKAFQATTKDYMEVVTEYVNEDLGNLSDVARRAIVDSEVGPQVLYHLAQNPDVAEKIAALPAHRQAVELGKLETKLSAPAKKASDAPPPVKPVGQGRSGPNGYRDNMSSAEFREWSKRNGARWAH